jgi:hypothetical protein
MWKGINRRQQRLVAPEPMFGICETLRGLNSSEDSEVFCINAMNGMKTRLHHAAHNQFAIHFE